MTKKSEFLDLDQVTANVSDSADTGKRKTLSAVNPTTSLMNSRPAPHMVSMKIKKKDEELAAARTEIERLTKQLESGGSLEEVASLKRELEEARKRLSSVEVKANSISLKMPVSGIPVEFRLQEIDPALIDVSPENQRDQSLLDDAAVADIFHDIKKNGQAEPGYVREKSDGRYELISGSRRLYCVSRIESRQYLALIGEVPDADVRKLSRVENQQNQISLYEIAKSYKRDIESGMYDTWESLVAAEGIGRTTAFRYRRMTELPEDIVRAYSTPSDLSVTGADWINGKLNASPEIREKLIKCARELIEEKSVLVAQKGPLPTSAEILKRFKQSIRVSVANPTRKRPIVYEDASGKPMIKHTVASNDNHKFELLCASEKQVEQARDALKKLFSAT